MPSRGGCHSRTCTTCLLNIQPLQGCIVSVSVLQLCGTSRLIRRSLPGRSGGIERDIRICGLAAQHSALSTGASCRYRGHCQFVVGVWYQPHYSRDGWRRDPSPAHTAASDGHNSPSKYRRRPKSVAGLRSDGSALLRSCCGNAYLEVLRVLLENGANIKLTDGDVCRGLRAMFD